MTPSQLARQYARDVLTGKIAAGQYVRLACERFERDLGLKGWRYRFDEAKADRAVKFMQLMPHTKGKWAAKKERLVLQPWQCFIECNVFGWVKVQTPEEEESRAPVLRRFRTVYEEVPRKNGKSLRLAARGLYLFAADGEAGAEVYSGATTEKQAYEIFRPAWQMAQKSAGLRDRFGIEQSGNPKNPGPMYVVEDMSKFEPVIGKPGDGASPHAALIDEYHEHDTDALVDTMQTGMGAREQPLLSIITTAGSNLGGPCYAMRRDAIKILEGSEVDETLFAVIYGIDPGDPWDSIESVKKANPNYGISVFGEFLAAQLAQAQRSAAKQNAYRTKHLNDWVGARTAWMNMLLWQRQCRQFALEDFRGCRAWIGVDLASKLDVAALVVLIEKGSEFFCIPLFYVPESAVEDNERYQQFVTAGDMVATPGDMTDYEFIEEEIHRIREVVDLVDVACDPAQATYFMTRLQKSNVTVVEFSQNVKNMSEPMKEVEALTKARRLWQNGNTVMTWMIGNVVAFVDAKEHVYPRKDEESLKIDGPVGLIISMGRYLTAEPAPDYQIHFM